MGLGSRLGGGLEDKKTEVPQTVQQDQWPDRADPEPQGSVEKAHRCCVGRLKNSIHDRCTSEDIDEMEQAEKSSGEQYRHQRGETCA